MKRKNKIQWACSNWREKDESILFQTERICHVSRMSKLLWRTQFYWHKWNTRWAFARKHDIFAHVNFARLHHKSPLSKQKIIKKKWFGISLVFTLIYIMIRTLHSRMKIRNFSSCMLKNISRVSCALVKYYSTLEEKFGISARPCNILYVCSAQRRGYPKKVFSVSL